MAMWNFGLVRQYMFQPTGVGHEVLHEGMKASISWSCCCTLAWAMHSCSLASVQYQQCSSTGYCRFGESLDVVEQEWIVSEINAHLEQRVGRAPLLEDMAGVDPPEVYDDGDIGVTAGNKVGATGGCEKCVGA